MGRLTPIALRGRLLESAPHPVANRPATHSEISVARRGRTGSTTLEVRITLAPRRVSPACVMQAYARVVPLTRRTTLQALPPRPDEHAPQTQPVGRRQSSCIQPT